MLLQPVLLALLTTLVAAAPRARQNPCHDYVIISVRGTYEAQGPSIAFPGMINQTLNTVTGGIEYDARYPAAVNQTAYLGAEDVVRYIDSGLQACPSQRYALLGYSQGASALRIALRNYTDTQSAGYKAITSILVVGNPYHKAGAALNIDQSGGDTTRQYAGSAYRAGDADSVIPDVFYSDGKLLDICYQGDVVCGPGYPGANFIPLHLQYGITPSVQDIGGKFLIERLQKKARKECRRKRSRRTPQPI